VAAKHSPVTDAAWRQEQLLLLLRTCSTQGPIQAGSSVDGCGYWGVLQETRQPCRLLLPHWLLLLSLQAYGVLFIGKWGMYLTTATSAAAVSSSCEPLGLQEVRPQVMPLSWRQLRQLLEPLGLDM
jgi:hypothetical protein